MTATDAARNPRAFLSDVLLNPDDAHPASPETLQLICIERQRLKAMDEKFERVERRIRIELEV